MITMNVMRTLGWGFRELVPEYTEVPPDLQEFMLAFFSRAGTRKAYRRRGTSMWAGERKWK